MPLALIAVLSVVAGVLLAASGLLASRRRQEQAWDAVWSGLAPAPSGRRFDPSLVAGLPAPARRFFLRALAPGAELASAVELRMTGLIRLRAGSGGLPLRARQILSTRGLLWRASAGRGLMTIAGADVYADGRGSMRWYLFGAIPIIRAAGADVTRSAKGRAALEWCVFLPSALLLHPGARWEAVDEATARVHLNVDGETIAPELTVDAEGRLTRLRMMRWDAEGMDGTPGYVLWEADRFSDERTFGGYTLATRMIVTTRAGTERANAFFEPKIEGAAFR